jgi:hypothetical protein
MEVKAYLAPERPCVMVTAIALRQSAQSSLAAEPQEMSDIEENAQSLRSQGARQPRAC